MPKPRDETVPRIGDARRRAVWPVSWRIASTRPREPPAAPAWPTDNCPPEVLNGNVPSASKLCRADEVRALALAAEAEIFDLQDVDDRIVVVGRHEVDVVRADAGLRV